MFTGNPNWRFQLLENATSEETRSAIQVGVLAELICSRDLPKELQCDLNLSCRSCRRINQSSRGNAITVSVEDRIVMQRGSEIRMVEDIEHLDAKLRIKVFGDLVDRIILEN